MGGIIWAGKSGSYFAGRAGSAGLKDQTEGSGDDEEQRKLGRDRRW